MRERPELMSVLAVRARLNVSNGSCGVSSCSVKSTKELEHVRLSCDFLNNSWAGPFAYLLSSALSQWLSVSLSGETISSAKSVMWLQPQLGSISGISRASPEHTRQAVYYSSGCTAHQQQLEPAVHINEPAADFKEHALRLGGFLIISQPQQYFTHMLCFFIQQVSGQSHTELTDKYQMLSHWMNDPGLTYL